MYDQMYRDSQARVQQLLTRLTADELAVPVPACPLWTVQDVLAHLTGVSASIADGSGANPASTEWTRGHVEGRKGHTIEQLFGEWHANTGAVTQLPITSMSWLPILHDTLSHEADIRGAIGAPQLPGDVLAAAYPLLLASLQRRLSKFGTVRLELDEQPVDIGTGPADLVVLASRFEFWRGAFGRRSPTQMENWVRLGDPVAFAIILPIFGPRDTDLVEYG
ncbi:MAG TPA: maleylpyruvate isomerase family mycothiol-dependent enzyme [Jatrophihabitans sp.]|jgi:uncharacterized protein (TIGR03083 family)|nr:maleylpyruvate isomerase family mycothiol-dependent enzyme [Jatrophihabitans sp.]